MIGIQEYGFNSFEGEEYKVYVWEKESYESGEDYEITIENSSMDSFRFESIETLDMAIEALQKAKGFVLSQRGIKCIVKKAATGTCLCDTCKHHYVSGSYRDEVPGCGLAVDCDEFYCSGCDGNNQCQGCTGYECMDQAADLGKATRPLTMDQLRIRQGKPVFKVLIDPERCGEYIGPSNSWWDVFVGITNNMANWRSGHLNRIEDYGKLWLAYDRELAEAEKEE